MKGDCQAGLQSQNMVIACIMFRPLASKTVKYVKCAHRGSFWDIKT